MDEAQLDAAAERLVEGYLREGVDTGAWVAPGPVSAAIDPSGEVASRPAEQGVDVCADARGARKELADSRVRDTLAALARWDGWKSARGEGYGALGAALSAHLFRSRRPKTTGTMSTAQLEAKAAGAHDLATFGPALSEGTAFSSTALAVAGSVLWLLTLPVVAVVMRILRQGAKRDVVPSHVALHRWLAQEPNRERCEGLFSEVLGTYERRGELSLASRVFLERLRACAYNQARLHPQMTPSEFVAVAEQHDLRLGEARLALQRELCAFDAALLAQLPGRDLRKSKRAVLREWCALQSTGQSKSPAPRWWRRAVLGLLSAGPVTRFLGMLGGTVAALAPVALAMAYLVPTLQAVVLGLCGWETFREVTQPDEVVPRRAKRLSVARTAAAVVGAAAISAVVLVPGPNLVLLPVVASAIVAVLVTGVWKNRVIFRTYRAHLAAQPSRAVYMRPCTEAYQQHREALELRYAREREVARLDDRAQKRISVERSRCLRDLDRTYAHLHRWQRDVRRGIRYGALNAQELEWVLPAVVGEAAQPAGQSHPILRQDREVALCDCPHSAVRDQLSAGGRAQTRRRPDRSRGTLATSGVGSPAER